MKSNIYLCTMIGGGKGEGGSGGKSQ